MADNNQSETPANRNDYKKYITYAFIGVVSILTILGLWYLIQHTIFADGNLPVAAPAGLVSEKTTTLADSLPRDSNVSFLNRDDALKGLDTAFKHQ